jgi:hypothetical protein
MWRDSFLSRDVCFKTLFSPTNILRVTLQIRSRKQVIACKVVIIVALFDQNSDVLIRFNTISQYQISLKSIHLLSGCYIRTNRGSNFHGRSADIRQGDANWCIFIILRCEHVHNFFRITRNQNYLIWSPNYDVYASVCLNEYESYYNINILIILAKHDLNIMSLDISSFLYLLTSYPQQYQYGTSANAWI